MRRIVAIMIILCLVFCLCGCVEGYETAVTVNEPCDDSVNGYRLRQEAKGQQNTSKLPDNAVYYANVNSKKFHLSTCGTAKRIDAENLYTTADRNELINQGYTPCKSCNP